MSEEVHADIFHEPRPVKMAEFHQRAPPLNVRMLFAEAAAETNTHSSQ